MKSKEVIYKDNANKFYEYIVNKRHCHLSFNDFIYFMSVMNNLKFPNRWTNKGLENLLSGKYANKKSKKYWDAIVDVISVYEKSSAFIELYHGNDGFTKNKIQTKVEELRSKPNNEIDFFFKQKEKQNLWDIFNITKNHCEEYYQENKKLIDDFLKTRKVTNEIADLITYVYERDYTCFVLSMVISNSIEEYCHKGINKSNVVDYTESLVSNFLVYEKILSNIDSTIVKGVKDNKICREYNDYKEFLDRLPFMNDDELVYEVLKIVNKYELNQYNICHAILNSSCFLEEYKDCVFISQNMQLN